MESRNNGDLQLTGDFVRSFLLPWRSVLLVLTNRKLFLYSLIPWFFNILIFAGLLIGYGFWSVSTAEKFATHFGNTWWAAVLAWIIGILMILVLFILQILISVYLANLLSGVFGEQLSLYTELHLTGSATPSPEGSLLKIFIRSVVEEFKGILFFLAGFCVILLLGFIPLLGPVIVAIASPIWSALSLAFDFMAPTTERRGMHFREKRKLLFDNFTSAVGFGLGILPMSLIPVVNFIFIPFAIVGGTRWLLNHEEPSSTQRVIIS